MVTSKYFSWFYKRIGGILCISLSILLSFLYLDSVIQMVVFGIVKFILSFMITLFTMKFMFNDYYKCLFVDECENSLLTPAYRKSSLETFYVILISNVVIISLI